MGVLGPEGYICAFNESDYCNDFADNDGDGLTDCFDTDCRGTGLSCYPCPLYENITIDSCSDNLDNDADGLIDCNDSDCNGFYGPNMEICEYQTESLCSDGLDNDGDGLTDCLDSNCNCYSNELFSGHCRDGLDNDFDGFSDCLDSDCQNSLYCFSCSEAYPSTCSNSIGQFSILYTDAIYSNKNLTINLKSDNLENKDIFVSVSNISQFIAPSDLNSFVEYIELDNTAVTKFISSDSIQAESYIFSGDLDWNITMSIDNTAVGLYSIDVMTSVSGTIETKTFSINIMENIPPTASISPISNSIIYGNNITINITAEDSSGVDYCRFSINSNDWIVKNNCTITNEFSNGTHTIDYEVYDNFGNYLSNSTTFDAVNLPLQSGNLTLSKRYFNLSEMISFAVDFTSNLFTEAVYCYINAESSSIFNLGRILGILSGNTLSCQGEISLSILQNNSYNFYVNLTETQSKKERFYICDYNYWQEDSNRCLDSCELSSASITDIISPLSNSRIMNSFSFIVNASISAIYGSIYNCSSTIYFYPNNLTTNEDRRTVEIASLEKEKTQYINWTVNSSLPESYNITIRTSCKGGSPSSSTSSNILIYKPSSFVSITEPADGTVYIKDNNFRVKAELTAIEGNLTGCSAVLSSLSDILLFDNTSVNIGKVQQSEVKTYEWIVSANNVGAAVLNLSMLCDNNIISSKKIEIKVISTLYRITACGNGVCGADESTATCPEDCLKESCGNKICDKGENLINCFEDCFIPKLELINLSISSPEKVDLTQGIEDIFSVNIKNTGNIELKEAYLKITLDNIQFNITPSIWTKLLPNETRTFVVSVNSSIYGGIPISIGVITDKITNSSITLLNISKLIAIEENLTIPILSTADNLTVIGEENITVNRTTADDIVQNQISNVENVLYDINQEIQMMEREGYDVKELLSNMEEINLLSYTTKTQFEEGNYADVLEKTKQIRNSLVKIAEESSIIKKTYMAIFFYLLLLLPLPIIVSAVFLFYIFKFTNLYKK